MKSLFENGGEQPESGRNSDAVLDELAIKIAAGHISVLQHMRGILEHAREIGDLLILAKSLLPHGDYLLWLAKSCRISERHARNYMLIARCWERISKSATVADLTLQEALRLARGEHLVPRDFLQFAHEYRWWCLGTEKSLACIEPLYEPYVYAAVAFDVGGPDHHVMENTRGGVICSEVALQLEVLGFVPCSEWVREQFNPTDPENWSTACLEHWRPALATKLGRTSKRPASLEAAAGDHGGGSSTDPPVQDTEAPF